MFFILSKILDFLLNPFYWVVLILIVGIYFYRRKNKLGRTCFVLSGTLVFLFTNPIIYNSAFLLWETPAYPSSKIQSTYNVGILLGGSLNNYDHKNERPVFSHSVDRLMQTIELYKSGKIRKILLSGGSGHVLNQKFKESDYVSKILIQSGVPDSDIIVENKSKNTYENAIYSTALIKSLKIPGEYLLITSAFHMRRSQACFNKAGLVTDSFPVDSKSRSFSWAPDSTIMPEVYGFVLWDILFHEWFGMLVYKIAGYA